MDIRRTHSLDFQAKAVECNIKEREKEIEALQTQHNIPAAWFEGELNAETRTFKTDDLKEAYMNIVRYQGEMDTLKAISEQIRSGEANTEDVKIAIVEANLKLVLNIAKKYGHQTRCIDFLDIIHEGYIGLSKAIDNFDYQKGFKFRTYATWWIRQSVSRAIANQGTIANDDQETPEES